MEATTTSKRRIVFINKAEFPEGTKWVDMVKAAEVEYPNHSPKVGLPGEVQDGLEIPTAFNGSFHPVDKDFLTVSVSVAEQKAHKAAWMAKTPRRNDQSWGNYLSEYKEAKYWDFRGQWEMEHEDITSLQMVFETEEAVLPNKEEAA